MDATSIPDPDPQPDGDCLRCDECLAEHRETLRASITDPQITIPDDVVVWFRQMIDAGVEFNPEDSFADFIVADTGEPSFDSETAARMDAAMRKACRFFGDASRVACAIDPQVPATIL